MITWYFGVAYFFGGAFAANAMPHLIAGISGNELPSPFATPPFRGLSSPATNVAWGIFNLAVADVLLAQVGVFDIRNILHFGLGFAGFSMMALQCARSFKKRKDEEARRVLSADPHNG